MQKYDIFHNFPNIILSETNDRMPETKILKIIFFTDFKYFFTSDFRTLDPKDKKCVYQIGEIIKHIYMRNIDFLIFKIIAYLLCRNKAPGIIGQKLY